jgi:tryptophan-rich sensory protein
MKEETLDKIKTYAVAIAVPVAVGIAAAALTRSGMDIYSQLKQPPLSPPALIFPIVWGILYVLMGVSSGMIAKSKEHAPEHARRGLIYYGVSLALNFLWTLVFFNLREFRYALVILAAMIYCVIRTIFSYRKVKPIAGYLQIPYVLWLLFAAYLNVGIMILNG